MLERGPVPNHRNGVFCLKRHLAKYFTNITKIISVNKRKLLSLEQSLFLHSTLDTSLIKQQQ